MPEAYQYFKTKGTVLCLVNSCYPSLQIGYFLRIIFNQEMPPPTPPTPFPKIHPGGFAAPCYTSSRRSKCRPLYGGGRREPTLMIGLTDDLPRRVLAAN